MANVDKVIRVHYLGIKLKAYTLPLVFMAFPLYCNKYVL